MKSTRKIIVGLVAVASLGIGAAVYAVDSFGPGYGAGMGPMGGMRAAQGMPGAKGGNFDPAAMIDGRLAYLKSALKITTAQESYWQVFSTAFKQQGDAMQAMHTAAFQNAAATAPDRMAQHVTLMQQQLANMETMSNALKDLYAVLSTDQKTVADQLFGNMHGGFGRHFR